MYVAAAKIMLAATKVKEEEIFLRIVVFLAASDGEFVEEFNKWIPSPADLAAADQYFFMRCFGIVGTAPFGALAYLKLGRDEEAYELAKIAVSPEQKTEKTTTFNMCYSTLGIVAAKRGSLDEANGYFTQAMDYAKRSKMPMYEVLTARDCSCSGYS